MFSRELVNLSRFPAAATAGGRAFDKLNEIVAAFAAPAQLRELSLAAWSLVHGYATLCVELALVSETRRGARAALCPHHSQQRASDYAGHVTGELQSINL
jgi:hypothetical protein